MKIAVLVFAGGRGSRLRPLTWVIPKAMLPVGKGKRMIDLALQSVRTSPGNIDCGTYVLAGHKASQLTRYLGVQRGIMVLRESQALGTGGAILFHWPTIKAIAPDLVLVLCSDHKIKLNLEVLLRDHGVHDFPLTVIVSRSNDPRHKYLSCRGNTVLNIVAAQEKTTDLVFTGNALIQFSALNALLSESSDSVVSDFVQDIVVPILKREQAGYHLLMTPWDDLGTWGRYLRYRLQSVLSNPKGDTK